MIHSAVAVELGVGQEHCSLAGDKTPDAEEQRSAGGKPYSV